VAPVIEIFRKKQPIRFFMMMGVFLLGAAQAAGAEGTRVADNVSLSNRPPAIIADVKVRINGPADQQARAAAMAKDLIRMRPGEPLTESKLKASIQNLKISRRFAAIHVDSVTSAAGETLIFSLTPARIIRDIRIRGEYPLFERDVLDQMTLYPGDPYTQAELSAQPAAIVKRYQREGYIHPRVSVRAREDADRQSAVILVDIRKGPYYILGRLKFEGNRGIASTDLKWHMKLWWDRHIPGFNRFSEYRLKKNVDTLLKYYRKNGFADAALSYRLHVAADGRHVDVTIRVDEGRRYEVSFEGNRRFWDLTLKKDVVIFDEGNRMDLGVRKSIRNMKKRYHESGYLDVRIEARTQDVASLPVNLRRLTFVIHEGPDSIVDKVEISGNHFISDAKIRNQMLTRPPTLLHSGAFVPDTLEEDVFAVRTLYRSQGFQRCSVNAVTDFTPDKTGVTVKLKIDEGPRTLVDAIEIKGLTVVSEAAARKALVQRIGGPYRISAMEADKEAITGLVSEKGRPYVTVKEAVTYSRDHTRADIVYTVNEGPLVKLGDIFISGNLLTQDKVIRRELDVRPDSPLSLQKLLNGQRQLRDLAIFHSVDYHTFGLRERENTVDLFVDVEENRPYYAEVSTGYESDKGLFGRAKIGDRNLQGLDRDLSASGEISETGHSLETRLTDPRFLDTHISASIGAFTQEVTEFNQPFGTRSTGGTLGFNRNWGRHLTSALNFRLERRDQFSVVEQTPAAVQDTSRTIFTVSPSLQYDSRNSFVRPTSGFYSAFNVDISKGIRDQLDDFVRYQWDTRYFRTPIKGITLAGLVRIGQVVSYGSSGAVPDDQLFFLGGIQSVRGYKENLLRYDAEGNPVGGKTAVNGSLEARIAMGMNLELTTFYDIGSVQDAPAEAGSNRFRSTVGLGLRYITPIGPMGLLYGYKLNREKGEAPGRLYLSIGYSF
jgi:outer membrane protein insertion porin family